MLPLFNVLVVVITKRCALALGMYITIKVKNLMDRIKKFCTEILLTIDRGYEKKSFPCLRMDTDKMELYGVSPPIVNPDIVILICDLVPVSMETVILINVINKNSWPIHTMLVLLKSIFTHWA